MLAASALPAHSPAANTFHVSTIDELRKALVSMAPELYNRAFRMSRSSVTAQDLVQDTVERALRFESQYRPGTNVKAWVHQILFSVFITKCRRNRRERKALDVLCTDPNAWTSAPAVSEVTGLSDSGEINLHPLFIFQRQPPQLGEGPHAKIRGRFRTTGFVPTFINQFYTLGLTAPGEEF